MADPHKMTDPREPERTITDADADAIALALHRVKLGHDCRFPLNTAALLHSLEDALPKDPDARHAAIQGIADASSFYTRTRNKLGNVVIGTVVLALGVAVATLVWMVSAGHINLFRGS